MTVIRTLILTLAFSHYLQSQVKPKFCASLTTFGFPSELSETNYKPCPSAFLSYRAFQWLDNRRVLLALSTTPSCSKTAGPRTGTLKLVTVGDGGRQLHSTTVPYDAGNGIGISILSHDGIWVGPGQTVVVDVPGSHLKTQPESRNKVLIFSPDLEPLEEIDTNYHKVYQDSISLQGVPQDRKAVLFWTLVPPDFHKRKCLLYTGSPLKQTGECSVRDLDAIDAQPQLSSTIMPTDYELRALPGSSIDGTRSSAFIVKQSNEVCEISGKLCPTGGELIVFAAATNSIIFRHSLPLDGRAALSPDGKRVATIEHGHLEVFEIP